MILFCVYFTEELRSIHSWFFYIENLLLGFFLRSFLSLPLDCWNACSNFYIFTFFLYFVEQCAIHSLYISRYILLRLSINVPGGKTWAHGKNKYTGKLAKMISKALINELNPFILSIKCDSENQSINVNNNKITQRV